MAEIRMAMVEKRFRKATGVSKSCDLVLKELVDVCGKGMELTEAEMDEMEDVGEKIEMKKVADQGLCEYGRLDVLRHPRKVSRASCKKGLDALKNATEVEVEIEIDVGVQGENGRVVILMTIHRRQLPAAFRRMVTASWFFAVPEALHRRVSRQSLGALLARSWKPS